MQNNLKLYLPLSFDQVLDLIRQLSLHDRKELLKRLQEEERKPDNDPILTHFASEKSLATDWLSEKEDEAWRDL